jgi:cell division protein ZapB
VRRWCDSGRQRRLRPTLQSRRSPTAKDADRHVHLHDLADRIERLVLRHEELKRTNELLDAELATVTAERDSLRSRLAAARARIDALLARLPADTVTTGSAP